MTVRRHHPSEHELDALSASFRVTTRWKSVRLLAGEGFLD
jgi:hypothetical protein